MDGMILEIAKQAVVTPSLSKQEIVQLDRERDPDLSVNGLSTFFLGTSSNPRVVATQIGLSPGDVSAGDTISIGSIGQLSIELAIWQEKGMPNNLTQQEKMQTNLSEYEKNLKTAILEAENEGKAIKLL